MRPTFRVVALAGALALVFTLASSRAAAQCPPVVSYYYPAPVVSYYAPAPVVSYYAAPVAAPVVSYYAAPVPAVSYYAAPVAAPAAVTTTYRYGLFGRREVSYTSYYPSVVYYR